METLRSTRKPPRYFSDQGLFFFRPQMLYRTGVTSVSHNISSNNRGLRAHCLCLSAAGVVLTNEMQFMKNNNLKDHMAEDRSSVGLGRQLLLSVLRSGDNVCKKEPNTHTWHPKIHLEPSVVQFQLFYKFPVKTFLLLIPFPVFLPQIHV